MTPQEEKQHLVAAVMAVFELKALAHLVFTDDAIYTTEGREAYCKLYEAAGKTPRTLAAEDTMSFYVDGKQQELTRITVFELNSAIAWWAGTYQNIKVMPYTRALEGPELSYEMLGKGMGEGDPVTSAQENNLITDEVYMMVFDILVAGIGLDKDENEWPYWATHLDSELLYRNQLHRMGRAK